MNPARILVVEDEMIIARELAAQLRMLGYEPVGHAARGEQAVALARELLPELVLMDIHLAGDMDGIAAAQQIRGQLDVPVIFVTAFATDEILSRAKITEPYGYILKPYSVREIHTVIEIALYKHKVDRKLRQSVVSLRESAQHSQAILDNMLDAVITINERGLMESFNLAASAIFGYSADEVMGHNVAMLMPEPHRGQHDGYLAHYRDTGEEHIIGKPREFAGRRKDGSVFPMGISVSRITRADQPVFVGLIHDNSVRRAAEEKLRTNAMALDSISQGVLITDHNRRIVSANAAFSTITGYAEQEILGRNCDFLHGPLTAPQTKLHISQAVTEGSEFDGQIVNYRKNGTAFWNDLTMSPVRNAEGVVVQYVGITRDVTENKRADEKRLVLEARLREAQKMEAIVTLSGGIAHNFNNILAAILCNVELARQDASANLLALESLDEIHQAASRACALVKQILSFSRRQPTEKKPTALAPVIEESVRQLRATLPARVTLEVHCDAAVPMVWADANQMQQILIILVTNAMQAMAGGPGRIGIRLDTVLLDAAMAEAHPLLRALHHKHPGRTLRLAVSDNGAGIDAATLERIFEPFFTTKAVDEGTGLGLTVVHGIVETHEGRIETDSQPGEGTTFTIYLPVVAEVASAMVLDERATATALPSGATGGHHILYLDDDASLVFAVQRLLEQRGYRVSGYTNQVVALDALRADPAGFDLVVTDYNMPGMSGLDVAREVRMIRANLAVAVASGFIDETLRAQAVEAGVAELIFKASAVEDLCDAFANLAQTVRFSPAGR